MSFAVAPCRLCKPSSVSNFSNVEHSRKAVLPELKNVLAAVSRAETPADGRGRRKARGGDGRTNQCNNQLVRANTQQCTHPGGGGVAGLAGVAGGVGNAGKRGNEQNDINDGKETRAARFFFFSSWEETEET